MKDKLYIIVIGLALLLTACGVHKGLGKKEAQWHTCVISGAKAVVTTSSDRTSASVSMQTVRDSLIIINIMPMLGIEMARLEATPTEVTVFDKVYNRYAVTTYEELNKRITPKISWAQLQQISSAELPTGKEQAKLVYRVGDETITFDIRYPERKTDVPVKMNRLRTSKYKKMDISQWL